MRRAALEKVREDPRGTAARILDAAEEVFAEQGYGAASTREMARRADIPFGALHYHWGSKKQLWEAVFKRLGDRTRDTIMRTLRPGNTVRELTDNLIDAFMDLLIERPNTTRLAYRMCLEHRDLHLKSVRDMFSELSRFGIGLVRDRVPDAQIDVPAAIFVMSSAFMGALVDVDAQEDLLGASVYSSQRARERLRAELKRLARFAFNVPE